ncbi:MAG: ATP-binding protein [Ignavibacteriae bacterium]|nr:ATP-binding protein [Ignavibacteriota bacterium]
MRVGIKASPVTAILGPRQCGKTTLAKLVSDEMKGEYFDLEDAEDQARLRNPQLTLSQFRGLVVLDEIQRLPELTQILRVLADRKPLPCRFLILGSASPEFMSRSSDSLAGRIHFVDINGFTLSDVGKEHQRLLWVRGGFPLSYLAKNSAASLKWRADFVRTFLERDLPQLGVRVSAEMLRRFWTMLAHYHGQVWNSSEIARSLAVTHHTCRNYLDLLTGGFVVRQLQPWFENAGKRIVKAPKVYIRDSGILHRLLNITEWKALEAHPKLGASWEGFVMEQLLDWLNERYAYFWSTYQGAELDLFVEQNGKRWGFEIKFNEAPTMTKSMHIALNDLKLDRLWVIYPGNSSFPMHEKVECVPLAEMGKIREFVQKKRSKRIR